MNRGTASDPVLSRWRLVHERLQVLSGGFNYRSLLPCHGQSVVKAVEAMLTPWAWYLAFYGRLVLEKPFR